jgi:hypothetical protein
MTSFRLTAATRWDALELMDSLLPYHPYLVQKTQALWELHAQGEPDDVFELRVRDALRRRSLERIEVRLGDGRSMVVGVR